jgi:adenosylcobyric acid synthase
MRARTLMVQGTMSSVGKSLIVAALCRIFKQDGLRVAPFKAQNMSLNSYATRDGREVGRAQAMQADAAGVDVTVEMNPVLIKPEADAFAQIVVMGKPWARLPAGEYMSRRAELWSIVTHALDSLREQYDVVVMEGAGSPAEINLRKGDLVNMAIAEYADAPVLLVGDIDRGGIFAQLLGTLMLLDEQERARVRGLIVNKFRGDARLFDEGIAMLEERSPAPVLGVVPFIYDLRIAEEDSVALETVDTLTPALSLQGRGGIDIAVVRFPHISNFDDFDPLRSEPNVTARFVDRAEELGEPDLVVLPGTKTTIADLNWIRARGIGDCIQQLAQRGVPILGICGGYQMLGKAIVDPLHVESDETEVDGLGLLDLLTTFEPDKRTERAYARVIANQGLIKNAAGTEISGYEIHMGRTEVAQQNSLFQVTTRGERSVQDIDGAISDDGWIAGTYLHGLFDNDALRHAMLSNIAARRKMGRPPGSRFSRDAMYDRLADVVRANMDMKAIYRLIA